MLKYILMVLFTTTITFTVSARETTIQPKTLKTIGSWGCMDLSGGWVRVDGPLAPCPHSTPVMRLSLEQLCENNTPLECQKKLATINDFIESML